MKRATVAERTGAWLFAFLAIALVFGSQPLAYLPPWINFDGRGWRLGLSLAGAGLTAVCIGLLVRRRLPPARGLIPPLIFAFIAGFYYFPPGLHGDAFRFILPATMLMLAPAVLFIAASRFRLPLWFRIAFGLYVFIVIIHLVFAPRYVYAGAALAACVVIPFAFALLIRRCRLSLNSFALVGGLLWLLVTGYAIMEFRMFSSFFIGGLCGNPNWVAASVLATAPWGFIGVRELTTRLAPKAHRFVAIGVAVVVVAAPSAYVLHGCHSRAVYVSVLFYLLILGFYRLPAIRWRAVFVAAVLVLGIGGALWQRQRLERAFRVDVRGPLWLSVGRLIIQHPFQGIGPGRLEQELPPVLAYSGYHDRFTAGEFAEHPHNEILNVTVQLGIPAALAWLFLLWPAFTNPFRKPLTERLAQLTVVFSLAMGMFDKSLTRPPLNVFWLLAVGILWAPFVTALLQASWRKKVWWRKLNLVVGGVVALAIFARAVPEVRRAWYARRGRQLQRAGRHKQAHAAYQAARRQRPNATATAYAAAIVSLTQLQDPELARRDLLYVHRLNPNYAHINRNLGRYFGSQGNSNNARQFFERELQLFPRSPIAWQWYFLEMGRQRRYDRLVEADAALRELYNVRLAAYLDFARRPSFVQTWCDAVRTRNWSQADIIAQDIFGLFNVHRHVDPFCPWYRNPEWPGSFLGSAFVAADRPFWQALVWRQQQRQTHETVEDVVTLLHENVELSGSWRYPHETVAQGSTDRVGIYTCFAWLLPDKEVLVYAPQGVPAFAVVTGEREWLRVDLLRGATTPLPDDQRRDLLPPDFARNAGLVVLPHEFLIRHQILGATLTEHCGYPPLISPAVRAHHAAASLRRAGRKAEVKDLIWQAPIDAAQQRLRRE